MTAGDYEQKICYSNFSAMFFQPSETEATKSSLKSTRKKRKKQKQKNKKKKSVKGTVKPNIRSSLCSWAENFTMAATWQLKHQVAMWKSRATALEYENQVLRETLRNMYVDYETAYEDSNTYYYGGQQHQNSRLRPQDNKNEDSLGNSDEGSEMELEISDEYMAFLKQNFEFRKAREERKKKEAEERVQEDKVAMNVAAPVDRTEEFKQLFGADWQKVMALDAYLQSQFISKSDMLKAKYWPNIPLRL